MSPPVTDAPNEAATTRRASALWIVAPERAELRAVPLPSPGPGDVLVQTLYSALSRGTETLVFRGQVPESEFRRMRCPHQDGDFPGPVKYGYSNVGVVLEGPTPLVGRPVFCLYPHQTAYVVPAGAVLPLPAGVPPERAVLAANLETALNACWDARPRLGDRVSVVGGGVLGSLVAYLLARIPGTDVELVDVAEERGAVAAALGAGFHTPETASLERDLVVHASATESGLRHALALAAPDAEVVELSWFGSREVTLPLGGAFHARRLTIRSSQVGSVSPRARARFAHRERLELALELLGDARLDALFAPDTAFDELPRTLAEVATRPSSGRCHRIRYP